MKVLPALLLALVLLTCGCSRRLEVWPDHADLPAEYPDNAKRKIEIARGVSIDAKVQITSKGNGVIYLPGIMIRIYDAHHDGLVFRDALLQCEWRDEDGDGTLDFVVSGIAEPDEPIAGRMIPIPVRGVFRYSAKERRFQPVLCSQEIYFHEL
ncbi:MAG: hypothetical protein V4773_21395 [Verrucomicrobiota bacterium]